ncbi:hypothetical protein KY284_028368 [Solanum tuberosum]|nr:hypothetical protein KY284_028368 [Solanum tuberosum]
MLPPLPLAPFAKSKNEGRVGGSSNIDLVLELYANSQSRNPSGSESDNDLSQFSSTDIKGTTRQAESVQLY